MADHIKLRDRGFNRTIRLSGGIVSSPELDCRLTGFARCAGSRTLYWAARKMKATGLRAQHPEWTEDQVNEQVQQIFLHART